MNCNCYYNITIYRKSTKCNFLDVLSSLVLIINTDSHTNRGIGNWQSYITSVLNRPGVAGPVLQTPLSLINEVSKKSFSCQPLKYNQFQTLRARELTFWGIVHSLQTVRCQMSDVMCHMSLVTCHMSRVKCHIFFHKVVELIGGGSVFNGTYPV